MKADVVVDVGNSRIKWGRCREDRVAEAVSLPLNAPEQWEAQYRSWNLAGSEQWNLSGVNPDVLRRFADWLQDRATVVHTIRDFVEVMLPVLVDSPEQVGIDRLLNGLAAKNRVQRAVSLFIVDAGSAVTVDWVDEKGHFRGGAILPGFRLMAEALHEYTALLPLVPTPSSGNLPLPGMNTHAAISAGIFWALAGGIKALLSQLTARAGAQRHRVVFLTGGDAGLLEPVLDPGFITWPEMTLEGIRVSAERLP